jgi:hypothetical protein
MSKIVPNGRSSLRRPKLSQSRSKKKKKMKKKKKKKKKEDMAGIVFIGLIIGINVSILCIL